MAATPDGSESAPEREHPLRGERLLELAVLAPLGALDLVYRELPGLVRRRRAQVDQQVRTARWMGEMAVRMGQSKLSAEIDDRRRRFARGPAAGGESAPGRSETGEPTATGATAATATAAGAGLHLVEPSASEPFPGYDALPAVDLVPLLGRLSRPELEAVRGYEAAMRNRRTVLARVEQLLAA